ncbi:hypothetical protein F5878DRAFT_668002, partial [Lentinula raphanica]
VSDFDDRGHLSDESINFDETSRGRRHASRKAFDQRRFLESDDSSGEDDVPFRPPTQRSESARPSQAPTHRSESVRPSRSGGSQSAIPRSSGVSRHSSDSNSRSNSRQSSRNTVSHQSSRHSSFQHSSHQSSRRSISPIPESHRSSSLGPPPRHANPPRRAAATEARRHFRPDPEVGYRGAYMIDDDGMDEDFPRHSFRASHRSPERQPSRRGRRDPSYDRERRDPRARRDPSRERRDPLRNRDHREQPRGSRTSRDNQDVDIQGYQSPMDEDREEFGHARRGLKRQASHRDFSPRRRNDRRRRSRTPSPDLVPRRSRRESRRRYSRSYSPAPLHNTQHAPERVPPLDNFRRPRHEMPEDRYHREEREEVPRDRDVARSSKSKVPFPKVTESVMPRSDPVGMLTSVSQAVISVLRNGWCEPIPLGHFARRNNLLFTSYTGPALDASSFHITEGGQVRLKSKRLHDISILELTMNDWNEIKRNMPKAIREHLIPDDERQQI